MKTILCLLVILVASINCQRFADIVFVIDEGMPKEAFDWVSNVLPTMEEKLISQNVGKEQHLTNLYGLVLFGSKEDDNPDINNDNENDNPRRFLFNNTLELVTAQVFKDSMPNILSTLNPTENTHDGYAALNRALDLVWRPRSIRVIIFLAHEDHDFVQRNVSRDQLISKLIDSGVLLNQLLDVKIIALEQDNLNPSPAFGVVYSNTTYAVYSSDGSQLQQTPHSKIYNIGNSSMTYDYVFLSEVVSRPEHGGSPRSYTGSIWDLKYILPSVSMAQNQTQMFTDAFVNTKVNEIQQTPTLEIPCNGCIEQSCFFQITTFTTQSRGQSICSKRGGELAQLKDQGQLDQLRNNNVITRPVWIKSWQGGEDTCSIATESGAPKNVDCNLPYSTLCKIDRSPTIGC